MLTSLYKRLPLVAYKRDVGLVTRDGYSKAGEASGVHIKPSTNALMPIRSYKKFLLGSAVAVVFLIAWWPGASLASAGVKVNVGQGGGTPGTSSNFELVGSNPLFGRGMNSAPAIYGDYAYIGNRTDGSSTCGLDDPRGYLTNNCPHPNPGVLITDISDPSDPTVVGEMGLPNAGEEGVTTRELRVWPEKKLLIVMTSSCSKLFHACKPGGDASFGFDVRFFDLSDPSDPELISRYVPTSTAGQGMKPHEFFLWVDPKDPNRALLWLS